MNDNWDQQPEKTAFNNCKNIINGKLNTIDLKKGDSDISLGIPDNEQF
jgi:hypothetical protein